MFVTFLLGAAAPSAAVTIERMTTDDQTRILVIQGTFVFEDDAKTLSVEAAAFNPSLVTFHSGGGNVDAAMRFGRAIRALGLSTLQLRSAECASACALTFLGGKERIAEAGAIGVHRASFSGSLAVGSHDAVSAVQELTASIITYMIEMGADPGLLQLSLSTDSSDMRYLTATEMRQYRVTTLGGPNGSDLVTSSPSASPRVATVEPPLRTSSPQRAVDAAVSLPDRMAVYAGLDFVGRDIESVAVQDAPTCAARCVGTPSCKAFTFNSRTKPGRGPNCFLKESQGQLDGNSVATSGLLLRQGDPEAQTVMFGAIDPQTNLYKDIDVVGFDLSRNPEPNSQTQFACRLACVNDGRCLAFTFVPKKKECWLKSGIDQTKVLAGAVTGAKSAMTYTPRIIDLQ